MRRPSVRPKMTPIPGSGVSSDQLRTVCDLLRQIGRPNRLRNDQIISRYTSSDEPHIKGETLAPSVEEFVRAVMSELPPRTRIALERTEFDAQPIPDVARAIGVSERQLYRDRALGLGIIARRLSSRTPEVQTTIDPASLSDVRLSQASMLEQVGQMEAAIAVLSDMTTTGDARDRASANCALARLALEQGSTHEARLFANRAISSSLDSDGDALAQCETDSILGEIAFRHGRSDAASQLLRRASSVLRSLLFGPQHDRATEALARSLIALSMSYNASGRFQEARRAVSEARNHLDEMSRPSYLLQLKARAQLATTCHFVSEDRAFAERELRACYDISVNSGFTSSALDIAVTLATFYRLRGAANLAIELMDSLVRVCKSMSVSRTKSFFYGSFATVLSASGKVDLADEMLALAQESALPGQPDLEALLYLAATRIRLATGSPVEALETSSKAQVLFSELGRTGLIGVSLHLRSVALIALGRFRDALNTAHDAVDALSAGHPEARTLAQATVDSLRAGREQPRRWDSPEPKHVSDRATDPA
jgi:tetratricopeptide (TPR) repeat protein